MTRNTAEIVVDTLAEWGVDVVFGLPGDGINGIMEALRTRQDRIRFVQVRHEEAAAFMACGYAKLTGRIGCCLATTGPGGIHLLNGLYDAKFDRAPVVAVTGLPYHDLIDTFTQQDVDHPRLFQDVAAYTARIMGPAHAANVTGLACRTALARRGVAHIAVPIDVQEEPESTTHPSPRNTVPHAIGAYAEGQRLPALAEVERAAEILNAGRRVVILAGQGALGARDELLRTAELLGAPIIKALLGKAVVPDDHPYTTGGIGHLGTIPSHEAMAQCDTLLIAGSSFPYVEYYPKPGQARAVQIDLDPQRIGLRYPVEAALVGDVRTTLQALNGHLAPKADRVFLEQARLGMVEWRHLLAEAAMRPGTPMKPQRIARELSARLAEDAIVLSDSGQHTGFLAQNVEMRGTQMFAVSGTLASMGCALPYAIAAAVAYPGRQVVAFVGDGGLAMVLGELATCVRYNLPVKIVVVKNNTYGQIKWEQMLFLGNPEFGCDLQPIDFAKVAEGFGLKAFKAVEPDQCGPALDAALAEPGPALVEAEVDPNEPFLPPKPPAKYVEHLRAALAQGTPDREQIERRLAEEPARTLMQTK
ncbi:MAG TPA: thiamine pyrophosphate-dependent enzyme [Azospirillaceae bacterium]|nr:thiamine pyrophosphate-dependent enzyme [Azospirillaceae bacterium]